MTTIQRLRHHLQNRYPDATFEEERFPSGNTWLDVRLNGHVFVVEHRSSKGLGVSQIKDGGGLAGYGDPPDRYFPNYLAAQRHLIRLIDAAAKANGTATKKRQRSQVPRR